MRDEKVKLDVSSDLTLFENLMEFFADQHHQLHHNLTRDSIALSGLSSILRNDSVNLTILDKSIPTW